MNLNVTDSNVELLERIEQWEAEPGQPMPEAKSFLGQCRWKVLIVPTQGQAYRCWTKFFKVQHGNHVILQRCLVDTSDRMDGVLLRQRYTYYDEMHVVNCSVCFTPYGKPGAASSPGEGAADGEVSPQDEGGV